MTTEQICFEIGKLFLQLAGAMAVAWCTVRWALKRYKAEKLWERQLANYVETLASLAGMKEIVGRWIDEIELHREPSDEYSKMNSESYREYKRRLGDAIATSEMLMADGAASVLKPLFRNIERSRNYNDRHESMESEYRMLDDCYKEIVNLGKSIFGQSPMG